MEMTEKFGKNLKILRKMYGLTQDQLANNLNTSRSCVSNYESGNRQPDSRTLIQIADFFCVSVDFLLGRSPVKTVLRNETLLSQLYSSAESIQNIDTLDMSLYPAKFKCALIEFYSYLSQKESSNKTKDICTDMQAG